MFISGLMDNENVVYSYNGILFSGKEGYSCEICRKMDGFEKY